MEPNDIILCQMFNTTSTCTSYIIMYKNHNLFVIYLTSYRQYFNYYTYFIKRREMNWSWKQKLRDLYIHQLRTLQIQLKFNFLTNCLCVEWITCECKWYENSQAWKIIQFFLWWCHQNRQNSLTIYLYVCIIYLNANHVFALRNSFQ